MSKLIWLIRLRWAAAILFLALALPAYVFKFLNFTTLAIYIGLICFLAFFNWLTHALFVQVPRKITPFFICFQLTFDLVILFSLLLITDGFNNPFVCLFLLNAGLGGVLIRGKFSWPFILLCHALLMGLQLNSIVNHSAEVGLEALALMGASHILVIGSWIVMRSLGNYLENHFENLAGLRVRAEKQDRLRALGALAAGFSHEFASPLNAAKLRLDRLERHLLRQESSAEILENLNEAKDGISACENVIHQMNSSQLDMRDFKVKNISINSLIHDVTDSWKEEHPGANLNVHLPNDSLMQIPPINFAQVLLNLLDNAFEAAKEKPILLTLNIENAQAQLTVEDEGPGFPEVVLERQGEPFMTTKNHGTGLGLYVSGLFAQSMGGQLSLNNKTKTGARVTLSWPVGAHG